MPKLSRRTTLLALASLACHPALACASAKAAIRYQLDPKASRVGFRFQLSGAEQSGTMPVKRADIRVDPDDLAASTVDVSLNVAGARTGLIFITQALTSADVLDAKRHPTIRFVSEKIHLGSDGRLSGNATISGQLTMRGITRPMTLSASLYRPPGSAATDLSRLQVQLSGQVSRFAFGASGYPDLVEDLVQLDISALIRSAP